jgi:hypothetical protein
LATKIDVEFHQLFSQAFLTIPGMNANIEELRFLSNISKTDKTEWELFLASILFGDEKAMRERMSHFSEKHFF